MNYYHRAIAWSWKAHHIALSTLCSRSLLEAYHIFIISSLMKMMDSIIKIYLTEWRCAWWNLFQKAWPAFPKPPLVMPLNASRNTLLCNNNPLTVQLRPPLRLKHYWRILPAVGRTSPHSYRYKTITLQVYMLLYLTFCHTGIKPFYTHHMFKCVPLSVIGGADHDHS